MTLALTIACVNLLHAQNLSGQNELRYRRGVAPGFFSTRTGSFENNLELNVGFREFKIYLRQRYLLPSEFGVQQSGLDAFDKKYIEYNGDDITVRGGDFNRSWGRGLFFGTTELIDINFDTGLEGLLVEGWYGNWEGGAFRGNAVDTTGAIREAAEGVWLSYRGSDNVRMVNGAFIPLIAAISACAKVIGVYKVRLGISGVFIEPSDWPLFSHPAIDRRGVELEFNVGMANFYSVYVFDKRVNIEEFTYAPTPQPINPHGFYSAVTWFSGRWGLLVDYKNYRLLTDGTGDQPIAILQYAPTGVPEATIYLLDRELRRDRYNDNVGGQFEISYNPGDFRFHLNINQGAEVLNPDRLWIEYPDRRSRYRGLFTGLEWNPLRGDRLVVEGGYKEGVEVTPHETRDWDYSTYNRGLRLLYYRVLSSQFAVGGEIEHAHRNEYQYSHTDENLTFKTRFDEEFFRLWVSSAPYLVVSGSLERSADERETGGDLKGTHRYWIAGEINYNFLERHQIRLFYGNERGGFRCSGGICRFVNPFKGVKITLTSMF